MNRRGFLAALIAVPFAPVKVLGPPFWRKPIPAVGGINAATFSFWRNQQRTYDATAFDNLRAAMRETYYQCSTGGESPTCAYIDGQWHGLSALVDNVEAQS